MTGQRRTALKLLGGISAVSALSAAGALPGLQTARAEDTGVGKWPEKAISYVVPFTPGGSTDVVGRTIAQKLGEALGKPVVVENRPGAAGGVGAGFVAKSKPDGYTLFGGTISTHAINASLYKNLPYDPVKDFEPVTLVAFLPNVLIVNPSLGVDSVADLVALLRKDPSKRNFASSGAGTSIGVKLSHIPYKGTPPAMVDVASGQVPFMFDQMTAAKTMVESGKLKVIAVTTERRMTLAPNLPTMAEAGVPGFAMSSWQAVYAPTGTPKPIIQRLNAEIVKILQMGDVREKLSGLGMEIVGSSPEELARLMSIEIPRWADLVKKSGATAE